MKNLTVSTRKITLSLVAAATLVCGAAYAQAQTAAPATDGAAPAGHHHHHRHFGGGVERAAMRNLVEQQLSQRTGRSPAEIEALFKSTPHGQFAEKLGLDKATMRQIFVSAHQEYVQKSLAAGLITSEQAAKLMQPHHLHDQQS